MEADNGSLLQTIIDNIPGGVTLFDSDLRMITCNAAFRRLLAFPDELFADGLPSFETLIRFNLGRGEYGQVDGPAVIAEMMEKARHPTHHVLTRTRPDGTVLEIRGAPLPGGGFISIYIDVTDRRRAEEEANRYATYLRTVLDSLPQGVSVFDEQLSLVLWNSALPKVLDFPGELLRPGVKYGDLIRFNAERGEYGDVDTAAYVDWRVGLASRFEPHRFQRVRPNGRHLDIHGTPMHADGRVAGFVTTYADITEQRQAEQALRRANELIEDAIRYSPIYVWEVDAEGRFTFVKGAEKVLGYAADQLIGRRFGELRCRDVGCREHRDALDKAFRERRPYEHQLTCALRADGTHVWLSASAHPMFDPGGAFTGYRGVGVDVTETTNIRKELEKIALLDPLTGLANRRKFMDRFKLETKRQERHGLPLSLLVIDIDHFKAVNDEFGHLAGDLCIKCVADALVIAVRKIDLVARFGGEEFVVLLPETSLEGARTVAEKLRTSVENLNIPCDARFEPISVTVSIGVATKEADNPLSFDDLMEVADQGLYKAKRTGRNRVCVHGMD